jgi:hypothetical protein
MMMIARRRFSGYAVAVASILNLGCYTAGPIMADPQPAERVVFTLNDRGRAALSQQLGSGPVSVEGLVESADTDAYVVRVSRVSYITAGATTWTGERVRIGRDAVGMMQQRKLSRGRTFMAIAAAGLAFGLFVATRGLVGWGQDPPIVPPPPSGT